jgi:rhodanese-related sulfurtransferase
LVIDVRRQDDEEAGLDGAFRISPDEIPARFDELPRGRPIVLVCT